MNVTKTNLFQRHIALPQDHGSWVFILSPLLIGVAIGGSFSVATFLLIVAAMSAFLLRQPVSILVKIFSGRRNRRNFTTAVFWAALYGVITLAAVVGLIGLGYGYVLILAVPGILVFIWHMVLISRRAERRQIGVEIVATGVLALAAPAAYWVAAGWADPLGWWLFVLIWLQSAASIVYAYLRLDQRELSELPDLRTRYQMGKRAFIYTTFNLIFVFVCTAADFLPFLLVIPYALQWGESLWGITHPAIGYKPTRIGIRQLIISSLFTVLFIAAWLA